MGGLMGFNFTPMQAPGKKQKAPFIEDARADFAPYYSTSKTPDDVQEEIIAELIKLGGYGVNFIQGKFEDGAYKRYGYEVRFMLNGAPGMFRVAGLPMKSETPKKR